VILKGEVTVFSNKEFKKVIKVVFVGVAVFMSAIALAAVNDDISARISPVGDLCLSGDDCAAAPVVVAAGPRSGEEIYGSKCIACHGSGAAGAPKFGDAGAWAPRISKGIDALYTGAISGFKGMPAKGLCMDCTDDEIKETVDYMVAKSK
jgi:cytochrome c5